MIDTKQFRQRYPRLYRKIQNMYAGHGKKGTDWSAAISMYLRGEPPPRCAICNDPVIVNKKFRNVIPPDLVRCGLHSNTSSILTRDDLEQYNVHGYRIMNDLDCYRSSTILELECATHDTKFQQAVRRFLRGDKARCCYHSSRSHRVDVDEWLARCRKVHGSRYDYSLAQQQYRGLNDTVTVICPRHGEFTQNAGAHSRGHGCGQCRLPVSRSHTEFEAAARLIHGDRYLYPLGDYSHSHELVTVGCPLHGDFSQKAYTHLAGPQCAVGMSTSRGEQEIADFFRSHGVAVKQHDRSLGIELDVYLPDQKIAVEYNGLYWHSSGCTTDDPQRRVQHHHKTTECENNGIQLFHIFEHEWLDSTSQQIWKSVLLNRCGLTANRVYARNTVVVPARSHQARTFFDRCHLQKFCGAKEHWALMDKRGNMVMMLSVGPVRFSNGNQLEIVRAASALNTVVTGGFSKLVSHIQQRHPNTELISFANRRWSQGRVYDACGFQLDKSLSPCYYYTNSRRVWHRASFMKKNLAQRLKNFNPALTEVENMYRNGYRRFWDSGNLRYVLRSKRLD